MNDRELLEFAAKAAGMNAHEAMWHPRAGFVWVKRVDGIRTENAWNPLTDDGDALRLAVKLAKTRPGASFAISISKMHDGRGFSDAGFFSHINPTEQVIDEDIAAATRRAIVRAAAEIGRAKP